MTCHFQEEISSHLNTALNRGYPKCQCLSRCELQDYTLGAGILASILPAKVGTRHVALRHQSWHGNRQSSSPWAPPPAIVAILPLDPGWCVQLNVAPCCGVHCHQPSLCPFSNVFLCLWFSKVNHYYSSHCRLYCASMMLVFYTTPGVSLSKGT